MAVLKRMSKEELSAKFPDPEWRERWLQLTDISSLFSDCIIRRAYKISDDINNAIVLSAAGKRIALELQKQQVPVKEAKLLCFLFLAHTDVLVDVMATDVAALRGAISKQVLKGDLLYPFIFGRTLYDRAAELFEDEKPRLDVSETLQLLDGTPQGVFQLGDILIGPYGLLSSRGRRRLEPRTRIHLYSCADMTCSQVHISRLATDLDAPINEHRRKLYPILDKDSKEPSA